MRFKAGKWVRISSTEATMFLSDCLLSLGISVMLASRRMKFERPRSVRLFAAGVIKSVLEVKMTRKPVIALVGTGRDIEPALSNARELARLIARNGWVLITGGRNAGVMKAANEGAKEEGGLTVGILPGRDTEVSSAVDIAIITDVGE